MCLKTGQKGVTQEMWISQQQYVCNFKMNNGSPILGDMSDHFLSTESLPTLRWQMIYLSYALDKWHMITILDQYIYIILYLSQLAHWVLQASFSFRIQFFHNITELS